LNEPLFQEAARALARTTLEAESRDERRARYAFRRVLSREPTAGETGELLKLVRSERPRFTSGELNPWNLATNDPDKPATLPKGGHEAGAGGLPGRGARARNPRRDGPNPVGGR